MPGQAGQLGKGSAQALWGPEALPSSRRLAWRLWEEVIRPPRLPFTRWLLSGGVGVGREIWAEESPLGSGWSL